MSITIGWWAIPALLTIASYIWTDHSNKKSSTGGWGDAVGGLFAFGGWLIFVLVVWLVYFASLASLAN
jgi:hypothetical protein